MTRHGLIVLTSGGLTRAPSACGHPNDEGRHRARGSRRVSIPSKPLTFARSTPGAWMSGARTVSVHHASPRSEARPPASPQRPKDDFMAALLRAGSPANCLLARGGIDLVDSATEEVCRYRARQSEDPSSAPRYQRENEHWSQPPIRAHRGPNPPPDENPRVPSRAPEKFANVRRIHLLTPSGPDAQHRLPAVSLASFRDRPRRTVGHRLGSQK